MSRRGSKKHRNPDAVPDPRLDLLVRYIEQGSGSIKAARQLAFFHGVQAGPQSWNDAREQWKRGLPR